VIALGRLRLLLLLLLATAIGCAPRGPLLPALEPGPDAGAAVAQILAGQPCPPDLASDLKIVLQTPEYRSIRMAGAMRAAWPDRIRIQARVGAFWPVVSIAVDGDSAFVSIPRLKGYWAGAPGLDRRRAPGGGPGGSPAALAAALLWLVCPSRLAAELEDPVLEPGDGGWILRGSLSGSQPRVSIEIHLPDDRAEVREILFRDLAGQTLMRARRSGSKSIDEARIAETILLETEEPRTRLEVRFLRPRRDPDPPPGIFRIARPPSARWIPEADLLDTVGAAGAPR
jgi:hypothetical protein